MRKVSTIASLAILTIGLQAGTTLAQDQQNTSAMSGSPLFWNVDKVLDLYVSHVTRYYNLDEDQETYTKALLTRRVKAFLKDYEKDVRSLAGDMIEYQFKRELPPPEIAREWARNGKPLYQAIKEEIINGNMQWRRILRDDQLQKHDRDLELMKKQFKAFEERLDRWEKGDVRLSDFGYKTIGPRPPSIKKHEDAWTYYVRSFIRLYNLDAGQSQSAYSALREMRNRATDYRNEHKEEFAQIEERLSELYDSPSTSDPDKIKARNDAKRKLDKRRHDLERPIGIDMFNELKIKLEKIPTDEQRRERKLLMDKLRQRYGKKKTSTKPTATTQPATASAPQ